MATIQKDGRVLVVPDDTVDDYLKQGWSLPRAEQVKATTRRRKKSAKPKRES